MPHVFANRCTLSLERIGPEISKQISYMLNTYLMLSTCPELKVLATIWGYTCDGLYLLSYGVNGGLHDYLRLPLRLHKRECQHAERIAIERLPKRSHGFNLISYSSTAPCYSCARDLYKIGINGHIYGEEYVDTSGVEYLLDKRIPVYQPKLNRLVPVHPDFRYPQRGSYSCLDHRMDYN